MIHYLISFPSPAMVIAEEDFEDVVRDSHAVIQELKDAGVYRFGGGLNEDVPPVLVSADGSTAEGTYPQTRELTGGFTVITAASRQEAEMWAAKIAAACRCDQELREFGFDPDS